MNYLSPWASRSLFILVLSAAGCSEMLVPKTSSRREPERRETRESHEAREAREAREVRDTREPRIPRDPRRSESSPVAIKTVHPRLLLNNDDFARVRELVKSDVVARDWLAKLQNRADKIVKESPSRYAKAGMLAVSRESFLRITTLAAVYRCTGDEKYSRRATDELLAVSKFPDWQPDDFLATAEMAAGVSLGFDWLFDQLAPADRATIVDGIMNNGVRAGLKAYDDKEGWTEVHHNWNFVCNGGLILGALAISDEAPKQSAQLLNLARDSMSNAMQSFAPDGGWEEGPAYWNYATRYATFAQAAMITATGSDGGLSRMVGFDRTGLYRMAMEGASGKLFNYSDCGEGTASAPQLFWMSKAFDQPIYAAFELRDAKKDPAAMDLLWYPLVAPVDANALEARSVPKDLRFRNVNVASMRSAWNDSNATYIGFKGGSSKAHHGHLDLGSFVLDALGQRWAVDLGPDSYGLKGYFDDEQRWKYYRCRTEGHNTLTIDRANQSDDAIAPIVAFADDESNQASFGIVDLTRAFKKVERVQRGVMMLNDGRDVLVQDEIVSSDKLNWTWHFHTRADVDVSGTTAVLKQGGKTLRAEILSPAGAKFEVERVAPPAPQTQDPSVQDLTIHVATPDGKLITVAVLFTPIADDVVQPRARAMRVAPAEKLRLLRDWAARTPTKSDRKR